MDFSIFDIGAMLAGILLGMGVIAGIDKLVKRAIGGKK